MTTIVRALAELDALLHEADSFGETQVHAQELFIENQELRAQVRRLEKS